MSPSTIPMRDLSILAAVVSLFVLVATGIPVSQPATEDQRPRPAQAKTAELFTDKADELGVSFLHFNGMSGEHYYPEMVGPGVALFDYDNDGDLDIFAVQGSMLGPRKTLADALFPPQGGLVTNGRLYRNNLVHPPGSGPLPDFTDVTEASGMAARGYGMGVASGDFDNDGCVDLYLTYLTKTEMWRNNCDHSFSDVTEKSGTGTKGWAVSAAFFDYDRDGWLDLFVGKYVDFSFTNLKKCFGPHGAADYCGPLSYNPFPNRLFHNQKDGTFTDVTATSKIGSQYLGALGVISADFDDDGWPDIYVANDGRANQLWTNQKDGTFEDTALLAGCALSRDGMAFASMGVDAGDFDDDGDEDIVVTNLMGEHANLYVNDGKGWFDEKSLETKLASPTTAFTGFGAGFLDYNNDGRLDIALANGEVKTIAAQARVGEPYPLRQQNLLFHAAGTGHFERIGTPAGIGFSLEEVSRGLAFGDLDNDGDTDLLIANNNGPIRLLINNVGNTNHWLGVRMVGRDGRRDMIGTRVELFRSEGPRLHRRVHSDGSYASASDPRVLFGLGQSAQVNKIRARWPDGTVEEWSDVAVGAYTTLRQGSGEAVKGP